MDNKHISLEINVFHGRMTPEEGILVGYGAIIEFFQLPMPLPNKLALISYKNRQYNTPDWQIFTLRYQPEDNLYKHLVFALKYEGVNLLLFKKLFERLSQKDITELVQIEPLGQYSRRMWFIYEWLLNKKLNIPDLEKGNAVPVINEKLQYAIKGKSSPRHRVINNLPGTPQFCPLIYKTTKLLQYKNKDLSGKNNQYLKGIKKDILQRSSAFLLLKDSKASFNIEGENPSNKRAARWGSAIGQAGTKPLNNQELLRLQQLVIENTRFTTMGFRKEGGFIGTHDRITGEPIPDHISARWQDLDSLMKGLLQTYYQLEQSDFDAILAATIIAFGFVFIHPFVDGNGRIHRYLIHHILAKMNFAQQGTIFPVSASILDNIANYRMILEYYSSPILDFIDWKPTTKKNVEILNNTADYYRYFDSTKQAEFLYFCVEDTIKNIIPKEVDYLQKYDEIKNYLDNEYEMPDKTVALLIRFLEQNEGKLSNRAKSNEFAVLTENEIASIEGTYREIFL